MEAPLDSESEIRLRSELELQLFSEGREIPIDDDLKEAYDQYQEGNRVCYERYHSEELGQKIDQNRVKDFVSDRLGYLPDAKTFFVASTDRGKLYNDPDFYMNGREPSGVAIYDAFTNSTVVFIDESDDPVKTEGDYAHELGHASGSRHIRIDQVDGENSVTVLRVGLGDSSNNGRFYVEEMWASSFNQRYTEKFGESQVLEDGKINNSSGVEFTIPAKYTHGKGLLRDASIAAYSYDMIAEMVYERGVDLGKLMNDTRNNFDDNQRLREVVDSVTESGFFDRLNATPWGIKGDSKKVDTVLDRLNELKSYKNKFDAEIVRRAKL